MMRASSFKQQCVRSMGHDNPPDNTLCIAGNATLGSACAPQEKGEAVRRAVAAAELRWRRWRAGRQSEEGKWA